MQKIMIVDDEPYIVRSIKTVLESEGYSVVGAESGEECLRKLKKEPVDLVLMDFFMPEMDGRMVIEKIRENPGLKSVKVAVFTSAAFGESGMEVLRFKVRESCCLYISRIRGKRYGSFKGAGCPGLHYKTD